MFPQTGECKRLFVRGFDIDRLFDRPIGRIAESDFFIGVEFFPFVEAVGGDEAASSFECVAESWFFRQRFATGVDHAVADRRVFRPMWDQPPVHELCDSLRFR